MLFRSVLHFRANVDKGLVDTVVENLRGNDGVRYTDIITFCKTTGELIITLPEVDRATWDKVMHDKLEGIVGSSVLKKGDVTFRNDNTVYLNPNNAANISYKEDIQGEDVYLAGRTTQQVEASLQQIRLENPKLVDEMAKGNKHLKTHLSKKEVRERFHGASNVMQPYSLDKDQLDVARTYQKGQDVAASTKSNKHLYLINS